MVGIATWIEKQEEVLGSLKHRYESELGALGRALKDALTDEKSPQVAEQLLSLRRLTMRVIESAVIEEVGYSEITRPKELVVELNKHYITTHASVMSKSIYHLMGLQMPRELLDQLIEQLVTSKLLPRRVTVAYLEEEYLTVPLFLAAHSIRQGRRLRGRPSSRKHRME